MGASLWERMKPITWYRSELGGWYLRLWLAGFHITRCH